jgi:deazaflavin-dependent oxidoreductase (nitroreductase family)
METKTYNEQLIGEFRANKGQVGHLGGFLEDFPILLLTTKGAKSSRPHTTPLMYVTDGDHPVVFASAGGSPKNPAWYHNLLAHPEVGVEIGEESFGPWPWWPKARSVRGCGSWRWPPIPLWALTRRRRGVRSH